jgi:hypothetical protein
LLPCYPCASARCMPPGFPTMRRLCSQSSAFQIDGGLVKLTETVADFIWALRINFAPGSSYALQYMAAHEIKFTRSFQARLLD